MKLNKLFLSALTVVAATGFFLTSAATASVICSEGALQSAGFRPDLTSATRSGHVIYITCTVPADKITSSQLYFMTPEMGTDAYATALTALSLQSTLRVKLSKWGQGSLVEQIELR